MSYFIKGVKHPELIPREKCFNPKCGWLNNKPFDDKRKFARCRRCGASLDREVYDNDRRREFRNTLLLKIKEKEDFKL